MKYSSGFKISHTLHQNRDYTMIFEIYIRAIDTASNKLTVLRRIM